MKPNKVILYTLAAFSAVLLSLIILIHPTGHSRIPVAVDSSAVAPVDAAKQPATETPTFQFYALDALKLKFGVKSLGVLPDGELLIASDDGAFKTRTEGRHSYVTQVLEHNSYGITVTDSLVLLLSNRFPLLHHKDKQRAAGVRNHRFQLMVSHDDGISFVPFLPGKRYGRLTNYAYDAEDGQLVTASATKLTLWTMAGQKPVFQGEERFFKGRRITRLALHDQRLAYTTNQYQLAIRPLVRPLGEDTISFGTSFQDAITGMEQGGENGEVCYFTLLDPANKDANNHFRDGGLLYRTAADRIRPVTPLRIGGKKYRYLKLIDVRRDGAALCYSAEFNELLLVRRVGSKVLMTLPMQSGTLNAVAYGNGRINLGFEGSGKSVFYMFRQQNGLQEMKAGSLLRETRGKVYYADMSIAWWDDRSEPHEEAPIVQLSTPNPTAL